MLYCHYGLSKGTSSGSDCYILIGDAMKQTDNMCVNIGRFTNITVIGRYYYMCNIYYYYYIYCTVVTNDNSLSLSQRLADVYTDVVLENQV